MAQHDDLKLPLTATAGKHANENAQEPVEQRHQHEAQSEPAPPRSPVDPSPAESTFFTPQGRPRTGRRARWKRTTTAPWPLLASLGWLLTRCQCGDARPGRVSSRRLEHRCRRRRRIDRTPATDPQGAARARPTTQCPNATSKPAPIASRVRANHVPDPSAGCQDLLNSGSPQTKQPQPELPARTEFLYPTRQTPPRRAQRAGVCLAPLPALPGLLGGRGSEEPGGSRDRLPARSG